MGVMRNRVSGFAAREGWDRFDFIQGSAGRKRKKGRGNVDFGEFLRHRLSKAA